MLKDSKPYGFLRFPELEADLKFQKYLRSVNWLGNYKMDGQCNRFYKDDLLLATVFYAGNCIFSVYVPLEFATQAKEASR
mgnify:CR=1 FL=1